MEEPDANTGDPPVGRASPSRRGSKARMFPPLRKLKLGGGITHWIYPLNISAPKNAWWKSRRRCGWAHRIKEHGRITLEHLFF